MFGPKSRLNTTSTRLNGSGGCSSSLRRPVTSAAAAAAATPSRQLAGASKSASRSSLQSGDSASLCSSLVVVSCPPKGIKALPVVKRTSSSVTSSSGSTCSASSRSDSLLAAAGANKRPTNGKHLLTSSTANRKPLPTLAMSLRDKENQIKLLIKERDEQRIQAEVMAQRAEQWEEKFRESELEKSHVTSEADDEVVELRRLAEELEAENKRLSEQLNQRDQIISDTQFKLDELEIESKELRRNLGEREELLEELEGLKDEKSTTGEDQEEGKTLNEIRGQRLVSKLKFEREIEELKEKLLAKEEQVIQLRSSLEMRKNEVTNLQKHAQDIERKYKIESERSERHLKRIDEINLELKASEAKLSSRMEEGEIYEKQVRQLRQDLRAAEEKLEQLSLARKKDSDVLHNKLSAARRAGSTTPTSGSSQQFKTPTPQDEIVRLQMEIRDLKDQLIDREAELDCNRRDLEIIKRKMETRTLEVDCNNQELARRCQDLLEQNRQSEDHVKQLLMSTTEHSAQLMRATQDLKEANGKCIKLSEEANELELKLEEQLKRCNQLAKENMSLKESNEEYQEQVESLREQCDSLNQQLGDLCEQLNNQTELLHKDREQLANQLQAREIEFDEIKRELATEKQNLRSNKLQTQEVAAERDRLKLGLEMKENYVQSRKEVVETLRLELESARKSVAEYKMKLEDLRASVERDTAESASNFEQKRAQLLEPLRREYQAKCEESSALKVKCEQLERRLAANKSELEEAEEDRLDELRESHRLELEALNAKLADLEEQLDEAKSSTLKRSSEGTNTNKAEKQTGQEDPNNAGKQEYETQIEFLNSLVVDMQRKCDDYKRRLSQLEGANTISELDNLIGDNNKPNGLVRGERPAAPVDRSSTLKRTSFAEEPPVVVPASQQPVQVPLGTATLTRPSALKKTPPRMSDSINLDDIKLPARISGRPFCDICLVYDVHHTIYCPKVSEKLAQRRQQQELATADQNGNNNYMDNNSDSASLANMDELFRDYERSISHTTNNPVEHFRQFNSLRRPPVGDRKTPPVRNF